MQAWWYTRWQSRHITTSPPAENICVRPRKIFVNVKIFALTVAVEAVPVVTLVGEHILSGQPVGVLLHPGLVALGAHLLVELDQVVLHGEVEQPLRRLLVQLVVAVHVARQPRQRRDLLLCAHRLDGWGNDIFFVTHKYFSLFEIFLP